MVAEKIDLDHILIIPFLKAIEANDPSIISPDLSKVEFKKLVQEFLDSDREFKSPIEKRAHKRKAEMKLIAACMFYLRFDPLNKDILAILDENKISIAFETYFEDIKKAYKRVQQLEFLRKQDQSKMPDESKLKKKSESLEKSSIFDMLTSLSTGLELSLDFNKMVVSEFISYKKALRRKIDVMKKQVNNKKGHGNTKWR